MSLLPQPDKGEVAPQRLSTGEINNNFRKILEDGKVDKLEWTMIMTQSEKVMGRVLSRLNEVPGDALPGETSDAAGLVKNYAEIALVHHGGKWAEVRPYLPTEGEIDVSEPKNLLAKRVAEAQTQGCSAEDIIANHFLAHAEEVPNPAEYYKIVTSLTKMIDIDFTALAYTDPGPKTRNLLVSRMANAVKTCAGIAGRKQASQE
jgi:hypothetical protein